LSFADDSSSDDESEVAVGGLLAFGNTYYANKFSHLLYLSII